MSRDLTTTGLIASVKRRASIPNSQQLFTNSDILEFLNESLEQTVTPLIMSVREEYFVTPVDYSASAFRVGSTLEIPIPPDAIGGKLRDIVLVAGDVMTNVPRLDINDVADGYSVTGFYGVGFYVSGNKIVFKNVQSETIRFFYYRRPSYLVLPTLAPPILAIIGLDVTLSTPVDDFQIGIEVDVISHRQMFAVVLRTTVTAVAGAVVTLASVEGIEVGDYVALRDESPVVQIPIEALGVLIQATCCKMLEAMGDAQNFGIAENKLAQLVHSLLITLNPRVDGAPKKITSGGRSIIDW